MTETREFHIGDILSVTSPHLVSPNHIMGVWNLLAWMTGEEPRRHQMPRFARECDASLREQFPDLAALDVPSGLDSEEKVLFWLGAQESEHGTRRMVAKLALDEHASIDPDAELSMLQAKARAAMAAQWMEAFAGMTETAARMGETMRRMSEAFKGLDFPDAEEGTQA
ncbi:DUF7736 domain-containing protein [Nocardia aurea]|jgi:hypothetical protein|uniref:DUF7736 domain-containing protein n=1 Tax=Nocardia aurea TaxID=2144174 RepID=UPI0033A7BB71